MESDDSTEGRASGVFVFNPFAEGYMAQGKAFTPVMHQARLAGDLANLPQFLCEPNDVVLVAKRPSAAFLNRLQQAGFLPPQFVEQKDGRIDPTSSLFQGKIRELRPWAWGPDSIELFQPLLSQVCRDTRSAEHYFNADIAQLYSKAWSADFLRKVLARCEDRGSGGRCRGRERGGGRGRLDQDWLCSEQEVGVAADTLEDALEAVAAIRARGQQRVVVKQALGLAGQNAIRLWEPDLLPTQRKWLANAVRQGRQLVIEPWLERALDFSVQLEMGPHALKLCGYTGLLNDLKGQYLANRAEADYSRSLPAKVTALLSPAETISEQLECLCGAIFSLLEAELQRVGFIGPISIDAFVYRTPKGDCQLKPVVEINPRYTMGRLLVELMKHACPGTCGELRLVSRAQARAEGFADFTSYARSLAERSPLRLEGKSRPKLRQGAVCLNDPEEAQVCLATFEVRPENHR